ncbi:MAG: ABC transporter permease [Halanaeroarchaeum sp.]
MTDILKYEGRRHLRGALALGLLLGVLATFVLTIYPSIEASGDAIVKFIQQLPEQMQATFAVEAYTTVEGFLATEFYQFMWLLLVGLYLIYVGGGAIATDVENGRIDLLLATPVSRRRVILEKYLALWVPIVVLNLLIPVFVYAGLAIIDESIAIRNLLLVHVFSVPYLALTAAIGLVLSVVVDRADVAKRGGLAVLFALFVLESVTADTDFEWIGAVSPMRYFDPADVLVDGTPDVVGAALLCVTAVGLVVLATALFERKDV